MENKHYLQSQMKSSGMAYVCWFILGCHYAYLGKWGWQILYWITLGGLGIWAFFDLFLIPGKVSSHNLSISRKITEIERREKEEELAKNRAMMEAMRANN